MDRLNGIIAPILTPFENDGSIAGDLWIGHAHWVFEQGAHYLSPFGTTGEALSVPISARMAALSDMIGAGLPPEILMPGVGQTSLEDTVNLINHCTNLGISTVMALPSFFYTEAGDDGQYRYFSELAGAVDDDRLNICLYNIPQNTGVPISPDLAARLNRDFPETFVAYKDSTGNWDNTLAVIKEAPGLSVFPGTENLLVKAMQHQGAGCISASVNLNAKTIRKAYDLMLAGGDVAELDKAMQRFRKIIQRAGLIRALKSVLAVRYDDQRWLNLRPPLLDGTTELGNQVLTELGPLATHIQKPGSVGG